MGKGRRNREQRASSPPRTGTSRERLSPDPVGAPNQSGRPLTTARVSFTAVPITTANIASPSSPIPDPEGGRGTYDVTFVLAIPGQQVAYSDVDTASILQSGDSLLAVDDSVERLQIDLMREVGGDAERTAVVEVNDRNRLSVIRMQVQAVSFTTAEEQAFDIIAPLLSRWSFEHDVTITIGATHVVETATQTQRITATLLGAVKTLRPGGSYSSPDGRVLLAAYREAISSLDPLYQALSMFRVIEGCYVLRRRRRAAAVGKTGTFQDPGETLTQDLIDTLGDTRRSDTAHAFEPYMGWKFTRIRDRLKDEVRHVIAHLDLDADPLAADTFADIRRAQMAFPVMHLMARILLAAEV